MSRSRWSFLGNPITGALVLLAGLCGVIAADDPSPATGDEAPLAQSAPDKTAPTDQKYELKYKFTVGQVDRYEVAYDMEMNSSFKGAREKVLNESQTRRSYKVTDVDGDGAGALELSIDWVRMQATFDNGESPNQSPRPIEFQSDDPQKQPAKFQHIMATIGQPTATIRFSPQGKTVQVVAVQKGQEQRAAEGQVAGVFTSHENYLIPLPEKPVAIGGEWSEQFHIICRDRTQDLKRVTLNRTYKLSSVVDGMATISFHTSILTPVHAPEILGQLIYRETAGKVVFDVERGRMVSRDSAIDKTVDNAIGVPSLMHAVIHYKERLLSDDQTASRESDADTDTK